MNVEQMSDRNGDHTFTGFWKFLRVAGWTAAAMILVLPFVLMRFTTEVDWTFGDLLFAGAILGSVGLLFEFLIRRSADDAYRTGVIVTLATMFLLIWINAAVGLVGSGANAANILYAALVAVPMIGGLLCGFKAKGMFRTSIATAVVQALIMVGVFVIGAVGEDEAIAILVMNAVFIVLWIGAALLFAEASRPIGAHPSGRSERVLRIHFVLSSMIIAIGVVLLVFMIGVEGEPGAIPLFITLAGIIWSLITWFRSRSIGSSTRDRSSTI